MLLTMSLFTENAEVVSDLMTPPGPGAACPDENPQPAQDTSGDSRIVSQKFHLHFAGSDFLVLLTCFVAGLWSQELWINLQLPLKSSSLSL